jgi:hypothetical protein
MRIGRNYDCFRCRLHNRRPRCTGEIAPADGCGTYTVRIDYAQGGVPEVRVVRPRIEPRSAIHMYGDGTLCLLHPSGIPWLPGDSIREKIIP